MKSTSVKPELTSVIFGLWEQRTLLPQPLEPSDLTEPHFPIWFGVLIVLGFLFFVVVIPHTLKVQSFHFKDEKFTVKTTETKAKIS